MEALILSKSYMRGNNAFVTAMVLETKQYIRLLGPDGWLPYPHSEYQIGQIWDIGFKKARTTQDPHNEDVIVLSHSYLRSIDNISAYILQSGVRIWRGSIDHIFDSRLLWAEAGAGYISELQRNIPNHSEGFWVNDKPLNFERDGHYVYLNLHRRGSKQKLKYKGMDQPSAQIPIHSLLQVHLGWWWQPADLADEKRCYLLLSGWH